MYEELEEYLNNITTPENVIVCQKAFETLERANAFSFQTDLDTVLSSGDNFPNATNLEDIFGIFEENIDLKLTEYGVGFVPETPLETRCEALDALLVIPEYGDPTPLVKIAETDDDASSKLSDMLAVVSPYPSHSFEDCLDYISPTLIIAMGQQASDNLDPDGPSQDLDFIRERFTRFRQAYPDTLGQKVIEDGMGLGVSVGMLLTRHDTDLDAFDKDPKGLAKNALSLVLISDTSDDDVYKATQDLLENYADNLNVTTKAHDALLALKNETDAT